MLLVALGDGQTVHAYRRSLDGGMLIFRLVERSDGRTVIRDTNSGSVWDWETGMGIGGRYEGRARIESMPIYWAIWARFHPETELIHAK